MNKEKYIKSILFKSDLIQYPGEVFKNKYKERYKDPFAEFVERYKATKELDPVFFDFFDGVTDRVLDIIVEFRFDKDPTHDFDVDKANSIIREINEMNNNDPIESATLIVNYLNQEIKDREIILDSYEGFKTAIMLDSSIYTMIETDSSSDTIDYLSSVDKVIKHLLILHGIINLNNKCPELFEDTNFKNNAINVIDSLEFGAEQTKENVKTLKKELDISKK